MSSEKKMFAATFEHKSPMLSLSTLDDSTSTIKTVVGHITHKINMKSHTPEAKDRSFAVSNFLSNIHGTLALSSFSPQTPVFVTGKLKVATMELPMFEFSHYEIATFLYYKVKSLYADTAEILEFRFHLADPYDVTIDLDVNYLNNENPFVNEVSWVAAMNQIENPSSATEDDIKDCAITQPWWRRQNGELRDFFNYVDLNDTEQLNNLMAYNIDLGIDMDELVEREERVKNDLEVAKQIADDYLNGVELPDGVIKEFKNLVQMLGVDIDDVLSSITDGSLIHEVRDEEAEVIQRMVDEYIDPDTQNTPDVDNDHEGPTIVTL